MIEAVREGYRWWNWGGTWASQKSLHHFKAGWGAQDRPYSYLTKISPDKIELLKRNLDEIIDSFPYYYLAPFEALR
jgi:hypothetical protein